jgi:hypothetical protein
LRGERGYGMKIKENAAKYKRTKRHYCAEKKCSECPIRKGLPYPCCESEQERENKLEAKGCADND